MLLPSSGDCLTQIDWSTEYACPRDRTSNSTWIITNPVTHQTFDLTSISPKLSSNHTDSGTAYTYVIGLGGHGVQCGTNQGSNIGACQTKVADPTKAVVLGRIGNLTLIDGKIHADYLNGDVCHSTKKPRRVAISFQYAQHDKLVVLPEQQCEYSFIVYTALVKENTPVIGQECQVDNFEELDWFLSYKIPPIRINSTLSAYISVCRPISLENQADTHGSSSCTSSNSGACLVTSRCGYTSCDLLYSYSVSCIRMYMYTCTVNVELYVPLAAICLKLCENWFMMTHLQGRMTYIHVCTCKVCYVGLPDTCTYV